MRPIFELTKLGLQDPYVFISIVDPVDPPATIPDSWRLKGILRLKFGDLEDAKHGAAFTRGHAQSVWDFLETYPVNSLAIHCIVGVSRSPSMAMAISDCTRTPRSVIQWERDPTAEPPNKLVYATMVAVWKERALQ